MNYQEIIHLEAIKHANSTYPLRDNYHKELVNAFELGAKLASELLLNRLEKSLEEVKIKNEKIL